VSSCNAKIFTFIDGFVISRRDNCHSHDRNIAVTKKRIVSSNAKRKAEEELFQRPKLIHSSIEENVHALETLTEKDISCIRTNVYNCRRKKKPTLPKSRDEAISILENTEVKTLKSEQFLIVNDRESGIVIFSCETMLKYLCRSTKIFVDGTFQCCTKFWLQLYTVHVIENGIYVPVAFCLLPDKRQATYIQMFTFLKKKCQEFNCLLMPEIVVADFEKAVHNAVRCVWPNVQLSGCRFHLG